MKRTTPPSSKKRRVTLTLSDDLVNETKAFTDNLSGVVESLLVEYINREQRERLEKSKAIADTVAAWNTFNAKSGSIAGEYSTL